MKFVRIGTNQVPVNPAHIIELGRRTWKPGSTEEGERTSVRLTTGAVMVDPRPLEEFLAYVEETTEPSDPLDEAWAATVSSAPSAD